METCNECKFFLAQSDSQGLCRRFPPKIHHYENGPTVSEFPPMLNEGWCGEHIEKEHNK